MTRRSPPLSKVCGLLEPGPVVLVTTPRGGRRVVDTRLVPAFCFFVLEASRVRR